MKKIIVSAVAALGMLSVAGTGSAGDLQGEMTRCLTKHANTRQAAKVTLECTASAGKLSNCKVVESEVPSKGFEAAAICVAGALPMGGKSGTIRVPLRFTGA
ncbi:MAG TPA: hypothetical protein VEA44_08435 [Caulobacter sp.]|nr:hypothetical protein [Caulobacter sp.]